MTLAIIIWYKKNKRKLIWRDSKTPYLIWVSEIMLQQTRVDQMEAYFQRFIKQFPDLKSLAIAEEEQVMSLWQGLGYYSRGLNLHFASKQILELKEFPNNYKDLQKLKGIGKYTAAAIASICFNEKVPAIDGNAYRLYSRYFGEKTPIDSSKGFKKFFEIGLELLKEVDSPGDFNQAVMDFASLVCTPKKPKCEECILSTSCYAYENNSWKNFPVKEKKIKKKQIEVNYLFIQSGNKILTNRRSKAGIWPRLYDLIDLGKNDLNNEFDLLKIWETNHILTHRKMRINFYELKDKKLSEKIFDELKSKYQITPKSSLKKYGFPKPLVDFFDFKNIINNID